MLITARHYENSRWVELELADGAIRTVRAGRGPDEITPTDPWVAPAFYDIQLNGRWGFSFSSPELTVEQVMAIVRAQGALGTARLCPTLISAPAEDMRHGVSLIAAACDQSHEISKMVLGIHLEGPFLSDREGYRGAHPLDALRDPDWGLFRELQAASGNRIILLTMAPERRGAVEFIARAAESGVMVALGHTAADGETIDRAVRAGARLSTHLGNGIAAQLPRHPNPIWHQAAHDELFASLIADGHHLDRATLRVLARAKGLANVILISDASPLAGLPAGTYGDWAVDPSGKVVVAGNSLPGRVEPGARDRSPNADVCRSVLSRRGDLDGHKQPSSPTWPALDAVRAWRARQPGGVSPARLDGIPRAKDVRGRRLAGGCGLNGPSHWTQTS